MTAADQPERRRRTTHALLARAQRGADGFNGLYERLTPVIYSWASLRIPDRMKRHVSPGDIVQEVWFEALRALDRFDESRGVFRSWIFGIASKVLLRHQRSFGAREGRDSGGASLGTREEAFLEIRDPEKTTSELARRSEEARQILELAGQLHAEDRQLFVHCALEGKPAAQAAELLGITAESATKRWQRLRKSIRESLPELLED